MTTTSSVYVTPRKPSVDQNRNIEASPNNQLYAGLPDLQSPPRRRLHVESFPNLLATGASPSSGGFGFPRLPDSSEGTLGGTTPPREGKTDPTFDSALKRYDPLPGRSPLNDFSSPSSRSLFSLKEPPLPIFHASPRRRLDPNPPAIPSYLSPDKSAQHFERLDDFTFSSPPAAPHDATSFLFQDSHSRISPTNLSAVAAAVRDGDKHLTNFNLGSMLVPVQGQEGQGHAKPRRRMLNFDVAAEVKLGINNARDDGPALQNACQETQTTVIKHVDANNGSTSPQLPPPLPLSSGMSMSIDALTATSPMAMRPEIIRREDIIDSPAVKEATNAAVEAALNANTAMNMTLSRRRRVATSAAMAGYAGRRGGENRRRRRHSQNSPSSSEMDDLNDIDDEMLDREHGVKEYGGEQDEVLVMTDGGGGAGGGGGQPLGSRASRHRKRRNGGSSSINTNNYRDKYLFNDRTASAGLTTMTTGTPVGRLRTSFSNDGVGGVGSGSLQNSQVLGGVVRCNCKKSRCMKMYCDCFKAQGFCGHACSCQGCSNKEDNAKAVFEARESILARNPHAFEEKIVAVDDGIVGPGASLVGASIAGVVVGRGRGAGTSGGGGGSGMGLGLGLGRGGDILQHRRGCNCKKSKCLKKYCECFQAGVPCGDACKCEECHNKSSETSRMKSFVRPPPPLKVSQLDEFSDKKVENLDNPGKAEAEAKQASPETLARPSEEVTTTSPAVSLLHKIWFLQLRNQGQAMGQKRSRAIDFASAAAAIAPGKLQKQSANPAAAAEIAAAGAAGGGVAQGTECMPLTSLRLNDRPSLGSGAPCMNLMGGGGIEGQKPSAGAEHKGLSNGITTGDGQVLVPLPLHALKRVSPIPGLTPVTGPLSIVHQDSPEKDPEAGKRKRADCLEPLTTKRAK